MQRFGDGFALTRDAMRWFRDAYVPEADRGDPRVCLLRTDPGATPPSILASAGLDPLLDSNLRYVEFLSDGGAEVEHLNFAGHLHGFAVTAPAVVSCRDALLQVVERAAARLFDRAELG